MDAIASRLEAITTRNKKLLVPLFKSSSDFGPLCALGILLKEERHVLFLGLSLGRHCWLCLYISTCLSMPFQFYATSISLSPHNSCCDELPTNVASHLLRMPLHYNILLFQKDGHAHPRTDVCSRCRARLCFRWQAGAFPRELGDLKGKAPVSVPSFSLVNVTERLRRRPAGRKENLAEEASLKKKNARPRTSQSLRERSVKGFNQA